MTMMEVVTTHSAASVLDIQMSKRADATMTIHTGRGYQGVSSNQNGGAVLQFNRGADDWRRTNAPSSDGGPEQQGQRKEGPRGAWTGPRVRLCIARRNRLIVGSTYDHLDGGSVFTWEVMISL